MVVQRTKDGSVAQRLIDGVIVLGGETRIETDQSVQIEGKDVIAVQTKSNRLGMYLMGQALFSRELLLQRDPKSVRTVAICGKGDDVMQTLCDAQGIEVVVIPSEKKCQNKTTASATLPVR